jgi:hypothetical protein
MPKNQTSPSTVFIFRTNNVNFKNFQFREILAFCKLFFRENPRNTFYVQPNSVSTWLSPCPPPPSPSAAALAAVPPAALPAGPDHEGRPK